MKHFNAMFINLKCFITQGSTYYLEALHLGPTSPAAPFSPPARRVRTAGHLSPDASNTNPPGPGSQAAPALGP